MSLTGILAGGLFDLLGAHSSQGASAAASNSGSSAPAQTEFQQLGQDLQSGNLSAARQDFAAIDQGVRQRTVQILHHHHFTSGAAQSGAAGSLAQDFSALAQALQAGNLSAAQSAFSTLVQGLEQPPSSSSSSLSAASSQNASTSVNFLV